MNDERLTLLGPALRRAEERPDDVAFQLLGSHAATVSHLGLIEGASRYRSLLERRRIGRGRIVVLMLDHGADPQIKPGGWWCFRSKTGWPAPGRRS